MSDEPKNLGDIFEKLLPAGSISGAPKEATLKAIAEAEGVPRGFYTGIVGYFDGNTMHSFKGIIQQWIGKF